MFIFVFLASVPMQLKLWIFATTYNCFCINAPNISQLGSNFVTFSIQRRIFKTFLLLFVGGGVVVVMWTRIFIRLSLNKSKLFQVSSWNAQAQCWFITYVHTLLLSCANVIQKCSHKTKQLLLFHWRNIWTFLSELFSHANKRFYIFSFSCSFMHFTHTHTHTYRKRTAAKKIMIIHHNRNSEIMRHLNENTYFFFFLLNSKKRIFMGLLNLLNLAHMSI